MLKLFSRSQLWLVENVIAFHPRGQGSIPDRPILIYALFLILPSNSTHYNIIVFNITYIIKHIYIYIYIYTVYMCVCVGRKEIGISVSLTRLKPLMELIYLTPVVNFGEVRKAQLPKSTVRTSTLVPWNLFRSFNIYSVAKERVWFVSNGKLPHLCKASKTATLVHEFAVEDLPSAELQPRFLRF